MRMVYLALFLFGGGAYVLLELAWRGRSHASMLAAGGVCLTLLYGVFTHVPAVLPLRCAIGACVITAMEFVAGAIVNVRLRLGVWDYSRLPHNLSGQICLRYFLLWMLLCIPVSALVDGLNLLLGAG